MAVVEFDKSLDGWTTKLCQSDVIMYTLLIDYSRPVIIIRRPDV